jgi:hypothetical protein
VRTAHEAILPDAGCSAYRVSGWAGPSVELLRRGARAYVDFCVADAPRCQLLFLRTVPGFEPSAASYALARHAALDSLGEVLDTAVDRIVARA